MSSDLGSAVNGVLRRGWSGPDAHQPIVDDSARRHDSAALALPTGQGLRVT